MALVMKFPVIDNKPSSSVHRHIIQERRLVQMLIFADWLCACYKEAYNRAYNFE
jgi:hypothetical protein